MAQNVGITVVVADSDVFSLRDVVRRNGTDYVKAQANNAANAEALGLVIAKPDSTHITIGVAGLITGFSSLDPGKVYFLDTTTPGAVNINEPVTPGQISKPCIIALNGTEAAIVTLMRGLEVPA
jgi:hypothetical protein